MTRPSSGSRLRRALVPFLPAGILVAALLLAPAAANASVSADARSGTSAVASLKTLTVATPKITGTPALGQKITAVPGAWGPAPVSYTYAWLRDGVVIAGAVSSYHTLTAADAGHSVAVKVTGTKTGYTTAAKTSASVKVPLAVLTAPVPVITGTIKPGSMVTAKTGTWSPAPVALTYQWYIIPLPVTAPAIVPNTATPTGKPVPGATSATFTVPPADSGSAMYVVVTGKKTGYTTVAVSSKPVGLPASK